MFPCAKRLEPTLLSFCKLPRSTSTGAQQRTQTKCFFFFRCFSFFIPPSFSVVRRVLHLTTSPTFTILLCFSVFFIPLALPTLRALTCKHLSIDTHERSRFEVDTHSILPRVSFVLYSTTFLSVLFFFFHWLCLRISALFFSPLSHTHILSLYVYIAISSRPLLSIVCFPSRFCIVIKKKNMQSSSVYPFALERMCIRKKTTLAIKKHRNGGTTSRT